MASAFMVVFCFWAKLWQKFARALDLMVLDHCAILRCRLPVDPKLNDAINEHVSNTTAVFVPIFRYLTVISWPTNPVRVHHHEHQLGGSWSCHFVAATVLLLAPDSSCAHELPIG